jgi:hypothetical protein
MAEGGSVQRRVRDGRPELLAVGHVSSFREILALKASDKSEYEDEFVDDYE